ncbi:kelch-like ECH-associated protein 1B [Sitodiplosis mosellana]|uniref:kelch-like ECH-associated protein 1B n=1 Tax=Sitodiplosis mosellana TaxID=263140 RepID=UPI00244491C0|nr:kelch-like ECH-associated protein 1B [Sitodiplosis mosellana]
MTSEVFKQNNTTALSIGHKLYLDTKTSDTKFAFKDSTESVVAHKSILSIGSPVFDAMFYGSLPEETHILIVDASPNAFKEFLQFFYLVEVQLSSEHIFEVANLCKKYEVNDGLELCKSPMEMSLTINNMCSGYSVALLLEMKSTVEFCKREITQKATEILKSANFLECDHKLFENIIQLSSSKCSAMVVVDACMAWAKAECDRENLEHTSANLKAQLKDTIDCIPFAELNSEEFAWHTKTYERFFDEDELEAIILKKAKKYEVGEMAASASCILDCGPVHINRWFGFLGQHRTIEHSFSSNSKLLLKEIHTTTCSAGNPCDAKITLQNSQSGRSMLLGSLLANRLILPFPIVIDRNIKYEIKFDFGTEKPVSSKLGPTKIVQSHNGCEISFHAENSIISRLIFERLGA